jgi:hypothetical protein
MHARRRERSRRSADRDGARVRIGQCDYHNGYGKSRSVTRAREGQGARNIITVMQIDHTCARVEIGIATNIQAVRAGVMLADEARLEAGLDPRGGPADELVAQRVGGRPGGTEDGTDDTLPPPGGAKGTGRPSGTALN